MKNKEKHLASRSLRGLVGLLSFTTVNFLSAEVTPGFGFLADASQDDDGNPVWENAVEGNPAGVELLLDDSPAVTRVPVTLSSTQFTHAYDFPGGQVGIEGGATLVATGGGANISFVTASGNWVTRDVTMEIWFKPDNLTPTPTNGQILFEDGGGTGLGLFLTNNQLQLRRAGGGGLVSYNLDVDPNNLLAAAATSEFIQAVATHTNSTGGIELFVNGVSVGTSRGSAGAWSGGDPAAFGTRGGVNVGGIGGGQSSTESFDGQMALIRVYSGIILTDEEVLANYDALSGPDLVSPTVVKVDPTNNAAGVYPGNDLVVTFSEKIALTGVGSITIRNLTAATEEVINLPDASVTVDERKLTILPSSNLAFDTTYAIQISPDAITDLAETPNPFAGINDDSTWSFATAVELLTAPTIVSLAPENEGVDVSSSAALVATFDNDLLVGSGNIVIRNLTEDEETAIPVDDTTQVSISGAVLTVTPSAPLKGSRTDYAIRIDPGALRNFSDLEFSGIEDDTTWTFTTSAVITSVSVDSFSSQLQGGFNRRAVFAVDGSGFEPNGTGTHSVGPDTTMWLSNGTFAGGTDPIGPFPNSYIQFDLGDTFDLTSLKVWNYNEGVPNLTTRGANAVTISVASNAGGTFTSLGDFTFNRAPGLATEDFGQTIDLVGLGAANVRFVRFDITSNHGGDAEFVGLSEVRFEGSRSGSGTYGSWAAGFAGLTDTNPNLSFDGGILTTGIEWVVGGNPTDQSDDAGLMPTFDASSDPDGKLRFTFRRTANAGADPNTTISVEYSRNLTDWTEAVDDGAGPENITITEVIDGFGEGVDEVTVALPASFAAPESKLFARLKVVIGGQ